MNTNIHVYKSPEDTARAVAELILARAIDKYRKSLPFSLAVSGGSTPKLLFSILAEEYGDKIPWDTLSLFWVDERCVPPTHAESNYGMTFDALISKVPLREEQVFRMRGEAEMASELLRYEELLNKQLVVVEGYPQFDMILLGMGDDGHTASIFPDNLALLEASQSVAEAIHPVSGQHRITLSGRVIANASEVLFLVTGASKAKVLRQIVKREAGYEVYPSSYVYSPSGKVALYIDEAAGSEIG